MYTTTIGRTFLKEYNRREGNNLSAKEFYDQEFFPLFFDHSQKYLMWIQNSSFTQGVSTKNGYLGVRQTLKDDNGETRYFLSEDELNQKIEQIKNDNDILDFKIKKRSGKQEWSIEVLKKLNKEIRKEDPP